MADAATVGMPIQSGSASQCLPEQAIIAALGIHMVLIDVCAKEEQASVLKAFERVRM